MSTDLDVAGPPDADTNGPGPVLLHQLFESSARAHPDRVAVTCAGEEWTYRGLDRAADRLALRLRAGGVRRGDRVAILLPRSAEVYVAILAALKAGAAYVPLDPDYPAERVRFILKDCQAHTLITDGSHAPLYADDIGRVWEVDAVEDDTKGIAETTNPAIDAGATPNDVCYIIYTSGTTGRPKGVQVEHRNACHLVRAEGVVFGVGPDDRVYQGFSIAFDASVEEIWLASFAGATLVVGTREMVQAGPAVGRLLTEAGVTVFSTVPTLLSLVEDDLPTVRLLILGGETCPQDLVTRWARPGRRLFNTYGPTEATVVATYAECVPGRPVTIGRPLPGYTIDLLDERLQRVGPGEAGEICIGGPGVARGYLGRPDLTRQRFVDDPFRGPGPFVRRLYRSGDLGRLNAEGELEYLGRLDSQVKLRGFRIELSEIESVVYEVPGVLACAVALREDVPGLPRLVAYVVPRGRDTIEPSVIREHLRSRLPAYMLPSLVETIDALPRLPSGKVDRGGLPPPRTGRAHMTETEAGLEGLNDLEKALCGCWARLFDPVAVTTRDDFFRDLGGHSLLAARMVSELREDAAFRGLSVLDVYQNPTIERLAAKLVEGRASGRSAGEVGSEAAIEGERGLRNRYRQASSREFVLCGLAQAAGLYFVLGLFSLQWLAPYLVYTWLIERGVGVLRAVSGSLLTLPVVYPVMLAVAVLVKWVVVGRYRAGEYPLWGLQYFKFWLVGAVHAVVPVSYLEGTPLLGWYYRLLGARIGANVHLGSSSLGAYDLVSVGDDTCIGCDTEVSAWAVEDGVIKLGTVAIGRGCFVGNRVVVRENTRVGNGARIEDLSLLPAGGRVPAGERWAGSPARRVARRASWKGNNAEGRPGLGRRLGFGLLHLAGQFVFPLLVIGAIFPGVIVLNGLHRQGSSLAWLFATPLVAVSFVVFLCLEIAAVKWLLLGRVEPGRYPLHSGFYVRKWFVDQLLELSLDVIGPLYATIYLAPWYRLLGAKLGRRAEVSTASFISPDLLDLGDEGFIADAVSLGAARVEDGVVTVAGVRVGRRAFIGNSALLPPGAVVGDNSLIGCLSTTPATFPGAGAESTDWLGSPAVFLPHRQVNTSFAPERTFEPTPKLRAQRAGIEFLRVILPSTCFLILTSLLLSLFVRSHGRFSTAVLVILFPVMYAGFGVAAALIAAAFKWALIGRYRPSEHPLWSPFVWKSELVTSLFENMARLFLVDMLQGTPFLAWYLRLLGAKIGKRVYLGTSEFTEFDLVEIDNDAAINEDCTVQTHLFEDRVMKMSHVRVGPKCSVGSQAVVLYDTEMREGASLNSLSLLMKGEVLPPWTRWEGSPARSCRNPERGRTTRAATASRLRRPSD